MQDRLPRLLALQELDLRIQKLNNIKKSLEEALAKEKSFHSIHLENLEKEKSILLKLRSETKQFELAIDDLQEKRKKLEAQQAAVKTNQEYKALNKEILDALGKVDRTEEDMIKNLEDVDEEKKRLADLDVEAKKEEKKLEQRTKEVAGELKDVENQMSELTSEREKITPSINASMMRMYTKVFRKVKGPALVPIQNRTCGGCHLSITAQTENMTRRNEEMILCENCSRILYYANEDNTDENPEIEE